MLGAATLPLISPALWAQGAYPSRPIQLIVPAGAGGSTDVQARALAEAAKKHLPQPITVNNRPGNVKMGNSGNGSIRHMAHARWKTRWASCSTPFASAVPLRPCWR